MTAPSSSISEHLVSLADGWSLWSWIVVRGAGFPAGDVLRLAAPDCACSVDALFEGEAAALKERQASMDVLGASLDRVPFEERKPVIKALRRLTAGQAPEPYTGDQVVAAAVESARRVTAETERLRSVVKELLEKEHVRAGEVLREVARRSDFREAVIWQNRGAIHGSIAGLLARPAGDKDSKARNNELLIASYLQRYATKNDTIGFFGPISWGKINARGPQVVVRPGKSLVSKRFVYFEHWGIELLAELLSNEPALKADLSPRRLPVFSIEGTTLHHPIARTSELPLDFARALSLCDGDRTAREIGAILMADPSLGLSSEDDAFALLAELVERKLATWTLEIPSRIDHPEYTLEAFISRAGGVDAMPPYLKDATAKFGAARNEVARAAGKPEELDFALGAMENTFTEIVGAAPTRKEGLAYAGRTLVFEDCIRDLEIELGPGFIERLSPPLTLMLKSARWFTYNIAQRYREVWSRAYDDLAAKTKSGVVDYIQLWEKLEPSFAVTQGEPSEVVRGVLQELQARWSKLLSLSETERRIDRSVSLLASGVNEAFNAPHPGWAWARYHAPDVLVAARGIEAFERGDYLIVMGELHSGTNTSLTPLWLRHHPDLAHVLSIYESEVPVPYIAPLVPKDRSTRGEPFSMSLRDFDLELGETRSWRPRDRVVSVGALVAERVDGRLIVRTRSGTPSFDANTFFSHYMYSEALQAFNPVPQLAHTPRVTIDGVVIAREQWRFTKEDVAFASLATPMQRFIAARAWAIQCKLPRFIYVKVPEEPKPCYVDFDSPTYVELFSKVLRKASRVRVSEMLPTVDETWLIDAQGRTYTCELRISAVDPVPWRPDSP